jgi:hypothetical protein
MKIQRKIIPAVALAMVFAAASADATAANPLLSGYGGPGQGSQAILGSALLNGPGAGGGSSTPSGVGTGATSATTLSASGTAAPARKASGRSVRGGAKRPAGVRPPAGSTKAASPTYTVSRQATQPLLGISKGSLIGLIIAIAALIVVGVLTSLSARTGAGVQPPKAVASGNRAKGIASKNRANS